MLLNTLFLALRSIRRNLLRSFLTILGIVIGVSAVITMVTLGHGATQAVQMQISSLGTNLLMVRPGQRQGPGGPGGAGGAPSFNEADADAILAQIGGVAAVAPEGRAGVTVIGNGRNWATSVTGSSNTWFVTGNWKLASGRMFQDDEQTAGAAVCIIGETVRREIYGGTRGLGEQLRIKQFSCEVIGVLASKGQGCDGQRSGRHGAGAAAHAAAPGHRQPKGQYAAGVDAGWQRQHAAEGQPAGNCCASAASSPKATMTTSTCSTHNSWPTRCRERRR